MEVALARGNARGIRSRETKEKRRREKAGSPRHVTCLFTHRNLPCPPGCPREPLRVFEGTAAGLLRWGRRSRAAVTTPWDVPKERIVKEYSRNLRQVRCGRTASAAQWQINDASHGGRVATARRASRPESGGSEVYTGSGRGLHNEVCGLYREYTIGDLWNEHFEFKFSHLKKSL